MLGSLYSDEYIKNKIKNKEDLEFLDSIISYLASNKFSEKSFQDIINNSRYPKQYFQKFNLIDEIFDDDKKYRDFIYERALNKLLKDNLIRINSNDLYTLDYEGMMLYVNSGLLSNKIKEDRKNHFQIFIWNVTIIAFILNFLFQLLNTYLKSSNPATSVFQYFFY